MDTSTRYKRVNEDGEWEYLCNKCDVWKPKERFKGCVELVDAYGNCLMCRSCISVKANVLRKDISQEGIDFILSTMGYEINNPDNPVWVQFHKKHNLPY
jgi:hypothetical protein